MSNDELFRAAEYRCFQKQGPRNTDAVLEAVDKAARELSISTIVIASCSGETARKAIELFGPDRKIICVTHVTGFKGENTQEMPSEAREELTKKGALVFTGQHAFGGVGRAIRNKLNTYQVDEIMAFTLRMFGQGIKVCVEICLMASDAGYIRAGEDVIAVGGTGAGADAACVIKPANSANALDLKVRQVICKPFAF